MGSSSKGEKKKYPMELGVKRRRRTRKKNGRRRYAFSRQLKGGQARLCEWGEPHFPAMHILGHKAKLERAKKLFRMIRE